MNKIKAIGYCRVSTEEQAREGISLVNQHEKIKAYALLKDIELVEIITDAGISAKNMNRPGIQKALGMLQDGTANALIIYKLDRFTRSTKDLLAMVYDVFIPNEIALHSITETLDTNTANGRFFLTMLGGIASWERETISERTRDALRCKQRKGFWLGGTPFGFERTEAGCLIEKPEEIERLAEIKQLRSTGKTIREIAAQVSLSKSAIQKIISTNRIELADRLEELKKAA